MSGIDSSGFKMSNFVVRGVIRTIIIVYGVIPTFSFYVMPLVCHQYKMAGSLEGTGQIIIFTGVFLVY